MRIALALAAGIGILPHAAWADVVVTMKSVSADGIGAGIGTVTLAETPEGLSLTPDLRGLPPGARGFHVHENGACKPGMRDGKATAALAAGGHLDPDKTGLHRGPEATDGHKGDLPVLAVAEDGTATQAVTAPHLTLADVAGRALMIHAGGDNYADAPEPLGGGGARIACGLIP